MSWNQGAHPTRLGWGTCQEGFCWWIWGACSNYHIIVTLTMQCNQLPANCSISPMTSITTQKPCQSISIKAHRQYKHTHLWTVGGWQGRSSGRGRGWKGPQWEGQSLGQVQRVLWHRDQDARGRLPKHTPQSLHWLLLFLLTGTAGRHSTPSSVVAVPQDNKE